MPADLHRLFSRNLWLFLLFILVMLYALGGGIARYLSGVLDPGLYWLGQLWTICLFLATYLLDRAYDEQTTIANLGRQILWMPYRTGVLVGAAVFLTVAASLTVLLIRSGQLTPSAMTILTVGVAGTFFYAIPPVRLASTGFGELTVSVLLANLVPALAFLLQHNEFHRLVAMSTFPLTFLILAGSLALRLPNYATHLKYRNRSLLVRLGWETAIFAHNLLLLASFVSAGLAALLGFPAFAATPLLLALPLAVLQIWYITRIANGLKPNWNALSLSAVFLIGFTAYLLTFAFWTH